MLQVPVESETPFRSMFSPETVSPLRCVCVRQPAKPDYRLKLGQRFLIGPHSLSCCLLEEFSKISERLRGNLDCCSLRGRLVFITKVPGETLSSRFIKLKTTLLFQMYPHTQLSAEPNKH